MSNKAQKTFDFSFKKVHGYVGVLKYKRSNGPTHFHEEKRTLKNDAEKRANEETFDITCTAFRKIVHQPLASLVSVELLAAYVYLHVQHLGNTAHVCW